MELYVGMLTHNCLKYTQQTVSSFKSRRPHQWVIVDNASTDGTIQFLKDLEKLPNRTIIRNKANVGVAKGYNQIWRYALADPECKYIFMIHNDVVLEVDTLDLLIEFVEAHPEYLIVSGNSTCSFKKIPGKIADNVCGFACFLITRSCIEKVGFFDEKFILAYFEDNDYHERVKRAGIKSCLIRYAGFYHHGSRTIHEGGVDHSAAFRRNRQYFKNKWGFLP